MRWGLYLFCFICSVPDWNTELVKCAVDMFIGLLFYAFWLLFALILHHLLPGSLLGWVMTLHRSFRSSLLHLHNYVIYTYCLLLVTEKKVGSVTRFVTFIRKLSKDLQINELLTLNHFINGRYQRGSFENNPLPFKSHRCCCEFATLFALYQTTQHIRRRRGPGGQEDWGPDTLQLGGLKKNQDLITRRNHEG